MHEFPKGPQDFVILDTSFNDDEIEALLSQDIKDVAVTIDDLKTREVNSTNSLREIRNKIENLLVAKKLALESAKNQKFPQIIKILESQIEILEYLI